MHSPFHSRFAKKFSRREYRVRDWCARSIVFLRANVVSECRERTVTKQRERRRRRRRKATHRGTKVSTIIYHLWFIDQYITHNAMCGSCAIKLFCWNSRSPLVSIIRRELFLNRDQIILLIDFANGSFLPWSSSVMLCVSLAHFARLTSVWSMQRQGELPVHWVYLSDSHVRSFESRLLRLI